ncbi:receptor-like protein EIX1 [Musa acuminata AAA Group]|uniref:receptor-like protein EIX1 n=1 Tax=Musa acuminata AAA Group TaxID=214697 RepID=UPI0031DD6761
MTAAGSGSFQDGRIASKRLMMLVALLLVSCCLGHGFGDEDHGEVEGIGSSCMESERRALLAIKSDMYDPDNWFSSWTGKDCCGWRGVACDHTTGHVTKLDLRYPYTYTYTYTYDMRDVLYDVETIGASKVNPSLQELKYLKYLDLSMNNFSHAPVPKMIASLVHLEYLNLSNAMFDGPIPPQLGNLSNLHYLDLQGWYFDDFLHVDNLDWLSGIPSLKYLDMSFVDLSKAINWFYVINSIPALEVLRLSDADLPYVPSPLPPFNLTTIATLDLSWNSNITSAMLRWLSNATSLENLLLFGCGSLTIESVQVALGALSNLKELDLSFNSLEGEIREILNNVSSRGLKHLDLSFNQLSGDIPPGSLSDLEYLDLSGNFKVIVHIFASLGNFTNLRHLGLAANSISGEIPQTVGNFVRLEYLDLSYNDIIGKIPESIGNLSNLVELHLSANKIVGGIPKTMGTLIHIKILDLTDNRISGEITETIGGLQNLQILSLDNNFITGEISETIGGLQNLQTLILKGNSFTGQIPDTIGRLHSLKYLDISNNNLSGPLPKTMGGLCNLTMLDLSQNNIGGELTNLFDGLCACTQWTSLLSLYMQHNHLSGTIPSSMGRVSQLLNLYLSSNSLVGTITEAHFSNLTNLIGFTISSNSLNVILPNDWHPPFNVEFIGMSFCYLGAELPAWLQTQTQLTTLYLCGVGLSGNLPIWFSNFSRGLQSLNMSSNNLRGRLPFAPQLMLDLSNNSFVGPIPLSFTKATSLSLLSLSHNHINGRLPPFFCNMQSLQVLDLSNSRLIGEVPDCPNSFPISLQSLHLNNNNMSGTIPLFLKHCHKLVTLDLGENKLHGRIPTWIGRNLWSLRVLRLRSNVLYGTIPMNIVNLTSLQLLDLSSNNLTGSLPSSLGNFSAMVETQNDTGSMLHIDTYYYEESILMTTKGSMFDYTTILSLVTSIDLSNNHISGEIPKELTQLLGLRFLNLSKNHLTGRIPEKIGDMKQLESLDLSVNDLTGEIPSSFSAMHFLERLNLSYNNLSGKIPTSGQLSTFDSSTYVGNKGLCGMPLPDCPVYQTPPDARVKHEDDEKLDKLLEYTSIVVGFVVGFWLFIGTLIMKQAIRFAFFRRIDKTSDWIYVQFAVKLAKLKSKWQTMT